MPPPAVQGKEMLEMLHCITSTAMINQEVLFRTVLIVLSWSIIQHQLQDVPYKISLLSNVMNSQCAL